MRILIDTSFLLPSLGVEVAGAARTLEKLKNTELKEFVQKRGFDDPILVPEI